MNDSQSAHIGSRVGELRERLQDVNALLHSVASAGGVGDSARNSLESAIQSIAAINKDLAAICGDGGGSPVDRDFTESRVQEAMSEVESGEFDLHG